MSTSNDPRVYFAAERTLLAWLRTGIAVMGVGFLVARFGLFLRMLRRESEHVQPHWNTTLLGVSFVLLGAFGIAIAGVQFMRYLRTIGPSERPPGYWVGLGMWYAFIMAALGLVLAAYLTWGLEAHEVSVAID
jgi:putative membrane protein